MIQAIETQYDGYRFRSRLEARWAVFLKSLGVKYEYEPEGFSRNGVWYLPDFRVQCYGVRGVKNHAPFDLYIEVKGRMDEDSAKKLRTFTTAGHEWISEMEAEIGEEPGLDVSQEEYDAWVEQRYAWVEENLLPILIVGDIPGHATDWRMYDSLPFGLEQFSYLSIDGDSYPCMPAADKCGHFYLFGADYVTWRTATESTAPIRQRVPHASDGRGVRN